MWSQVDELVSLSENLRRGCNDRYLDYDHILRSEGEMENFSSRVSLIGMIMNVTAISLPRTTFNAKAL
jgi:hypothetical protein